MVAIRGWWSRLGQVERVELYTVQTLHVLLWLTHGLILLGTAPDDRVGTGRMAVLVGCALALGISGSRALAAATRLYPATEPLPVRPLATLAAVAVAVEVLAIVGGPDFESAGMLVWNGLAWGFGGLRGRTRTIVLLLVLTLAPALPAASPFLAAYGLIGGALFVVTTRASLWLLDVVRKLDRATGAQAALAVAEERLRFSRDVHDVLGRRLSAIAVQAELASALATRGDPRAADRMMEVRSVAHEALREARELARGYRASDLPQELEGARSLLRSAGITTVIDVDGLPERWHEAAAWVVRESVTNVLRHSQATTVWIQYDAPRLRLANDGVGDAVAGARGHGLLGLAERLAPLGASLDTVRDGTRFEVVVLLPATDEPRQADAPTREDAG